MLNPILIGSPDCGRGHHHGGGREDGFNLEGHIVSSVWSFWSGAF
jgi:hypothetical protein